MPEIHVVQGEPRECSDAIVARGLVEEWIAQPDATEKKIARILADEARTRDTARNDTIKAPETSSGPTPPRRPRPEKE